MWARLVLAALSWSGPPAEGRDELDLSWSVRGPDGCDDAAFRRQLAGFLAQTRERPAADLRVAVELQAGDGGTWTIDLHVQDSTGATDRHFEAARCETVVEAAALVVAMKIDPSVLGAQPEPEPEPEPEPMPAPPPAVDPQPEPEPAPTPVGPRLGVGLRVQGGLAALALPAATGQLGGVVFLVGEGWRVGLGGRYRFATRAEVDGRGAGGEFRLGAGQLVGCGVVARGALEIPLCGALEVGGIAAAGYGITESRSSRRPWLAARAQPGIAYVPRPWLAAGLAFDLGLVISRERYFIEGLGHVHTVGPVELGALLFVEFRLLGGSS